MAPKTKATATPPKETWASPSPINDIFWIIRNTPRNPATTVTIIDAINALWNISHLKKKGKISPGINGAIDSKRGATRSRMNTPIPNIMNPPLGDGGGRGHF